jgi:large subunit ribosomal protein L29
VEELKELLKELQAELMKLRSQVAAGTRPENPGRIRAIRRDIARIKTILREKGVSG